jgi:DNA excision repair protein ERCC-3
MGIARKWRIAEMDLWDQDPLELVGPAFIEFGKGRSGQFRFVAVEGWIEWVHKGRNGRPYVEFTWNGNDECDPVSDGRESDVFALIGPKRFDVPWKDLERQAWIATATCIELRVPMSAERRMEYALTERRSQFRVAAENPAKMTHLRELLQRYPDGRILVIGAYIDQVETIAKEIGAPLVAGKTPEIERERIYERFRKGELRCIVLSKVGNFAIDLPDADLLIQVSGAFGSRQEEAQRLGRVLRPKDDGRAARFFTLVSRDTREEEFAHHRKLFLTEQGYSYQVHLAEELSKAR